MANEETLGLPWAILQYSRIMTVMHRISVPFLLCILSPRSREGNKIIWFYVTILTARGIKSCWKTGLLAKWTVKHEPPFASTCIHKLLSRHTYSIEFRGIIHVYSVTQLWSHNIGTLFGTKQKAEIKLLFYNIQNYFRPRIANASKS